MASYASKNVVYSEAFMALILGAMKVDPGAALIVTPKLRLSQDPGLVITPVTLLADLEALEADFSGYTTGGYTPTFTVELNPSLNVRAIAANVIPIAATADPFVANTCTGWWIDNGTDWLAGEVFAEGFTAGFSVPGSYLDLLALLLLQGYQARGN